MSGKTIINYNMFQEKYFFPEFEKFHQNSLSFPSFPESLQKPGFMNPASCPAGKLKNIYEVQNKVQPSSSL